MKVFLLTVGLPQHGPGDEVIHIVKTLSFAAPGKIVMYCPVETLMYYDVKQIAIDVLTIDRRVCPQCAETANLYHRVTSPWD